MKKHLIFKRKKKSKTFFLFTFIIILLTLVYIYKSNIFDLIKPKITLNYDLNKKHNILYWNKKKLIPVNIFDNLAIRNFEISLLDKKNLITLFKQNFIETITNINKKIFFPDNGVIDLDIKELELIIKVRDKSNWNFFLGNTNKKKIKILIDVDAPKIKILSHSYNIVQGGSGLIIFQVVDKNLQTVYVKVNNKKIKVQKYKKDGYFIALLPWPFNVDNIKFTIIATDYADNTKLLEIPFYKKNKLYRTSWIKLKNHFLDVVISNLISSYKEYDYITNRLLKFKTINEDLRVINERLISSYEFIPIKNNIETWNINKFYPLPRSQKVASFGDTRYFYKKKKKIISKSYHLGLDLASIKHDNIVGNYGKVIFSGYNGIYGNMILIDHDLGLKSIYGHCNTLLVMKGDIIVNKTIIGKTGKTGLALGDHLHFGIILHDIAVRPEEWMDQHWIDNNINKVLKKADKLIM